MKRFFTFILSLLLPALLFSGQNKAVLLPNGQMIEKNVGNHGRTNEVLPLKHSIVDYRGFNKINPYDNGVEGISGTIDTLRYGPATGNPPWNSKT